MGTFIGALLMGMIRTGLVSRCSPIPIHCLHWNNIGGFSYRQYDGDQEEGRPMTREELRKDNEAIVQMVGIGKTFGAVESPI